MHWLPGFALNLRRHLGVAGGAAGIAAVSMAAYAATAPVYVDAETAVAELSADRHIEAVAPFGTVSRAAVKVGALNETTGDGLADSPAGGNEFFNTQCTACHGADARGIEGLGVSLVDSGYVAASGVDRLTAFLKVGRMLNDPDSITGRPMPGFAWADDAQLAEIAEYLKSLIRN
jgi:mono/diheme cytochrome c family protein